MTRAMAVATRTRRLPLGPSSSMRTLAVLIVQASYRWIA
jgi:hypothetical protein